jgi:hypothetical protein
LNPKQHHRTLTFNQRFRVARVIDRFSRSSLPSDNDFHCNRHILAMSLRVIDKTLFHQHTRQM